MDKFERFFKENRLLLDSEDLEKSQWERIEASFKDYNRRIFFSRLLVAAGILVIMALGMFLYMSHNYVQNRPQKGLLSGLSNNMSQEENFYIHSINLTSDSIRNIKVPVEYENMFKDFIQQLQIIDQQYEIYRKQIAEHGYNQELIQQIIYNYQLKLNVLQSLQKEINKINSLTKQIRNENKKIQLDV